MEEQSNQSLPMGNEPMNPGLHLEQFKKMRLKLFVLIVDREVMKKVTKVLHEQNVRMHFVCMASGTATSEWLDVLGIGSTDNAMVFCIEPEYRIKHLKEVLSERLQLHKPGRGVLFTIPLSGVAGPMMHLLDDDVKEKLEKKMEKEVEKMKTEARYDLIVAVINQGFSDDLMDAAREVGARGGTVLHARRICQEDVVKFLGICVQPEKEVVAIITPKENKQAIMKAVSKACGMKTEAKGIVLALPVEDIEGLSME